MSKQAEFAVILKINPMFADLGADELQRISGLCHTEQLGLGEMLFQKGDAGDALYGVRRGQIRIETGASDGSRLTLIFMGPADLFGEVAVLAGESRTADATAGEPSELFVLRREDFLAFLEREPKVAIKIRSEDHASELQSQSNLVCRLLLEKKKKQLKPKHYHTLLRVVATGPCFIRHYVVRY